MHELILHHHDPSPFADKIRLIFGIKGLQWLSVQIPMIMPKPDLTALTGGYRKTPVLQVGADIYCDTSLIARELETRFPSPSLFPKGPSGLGYVLSRWSDKTFFEPGAGLSMGENKAIPEAVLEDRKNFFDFMDFDRMPAEMPHCYAQFQAQCQLLEDELNAAESDYLTGAEPAWIDILAYFPVWMVSGNVPRAAELLSPFTAIDRWASRMENIGRGERAELDSKDALAIAADTEPERASGIAASPFHGFAEDDRVVVVPTDNGAVPVTGRLLGLDTYRISLGRSDESLGNTAVHFPRSGYRIEPA